MPDRILLALYAAAIVLTAAWVVPMWIIYGWLAGVANLSACLFAFAWPYILERLILTLPTSD